MDNTTNCWLRKTQLETGLLLILIISGPFIFVMVIIYGVLISNGCPYCSIDCGSLCKNASLQYLSDAFDYFNIIPAFFQLDSNIPLSNLTEKYEICSESVRERFNLQIDHPVVASLSEDVYIDSLSDQRYVCAAVIITFKWLLSSSTCIKNQDQISSGIYGIFVRAGSNYWIKNGSEHEIQNVVISDSAGLAAIELKLAFPRLPSIRPVVLSLTSFYADYEKAEIYGWKNNDDSLPLRYRKKYVTMTSLSVIIFKDDRCRKAIGGVGGNSDLFCAMAVPPEELTCIYFTGSPLIIQNVLIGIVVGGICNTNNNSTIYLVYEVSKAMSWLKQITNVYVELA